MWKLITDTRNTVQWEPGRISSAVNCSENWPYKQADWLWKYQNVSWGNEFEIQDTVSLDWTLRKTALYERPVLQLQSQDTKRKLW